MSLAARTREAVRANPFLHQALRAGVVNYTAAARYLDLGADDEEAVVAALRRYADSLSAPGTTDRTAPVSMESGLGEGDPDDALLVLGDTALVPGAGSMTGVLATGEVDATALRHVLGRLATDAIDVSAAAVTGEALLVVVDRRDGPDTLRTVEDALATVPRRSDPP
jgi:hypothetical protein